PTCSPMSWIGLRDRADERRRMHDMRDPVPLDHVQEARQIEHIAELDVDVIENVGNERLVAMAGKDDRPVSLVYEPAARLGAHDAHAAGNQNLHVFMTPISLSRLDEYSTAVEVRTAARQTRSAP